MSDAHEAGKGLIGVASNAKLTADLTVALTAKPRRQFSNSDSERRESVTHCKAKIRQTQANLGRALRLDVIGAAT